MKKLDCALNTQVSLNNNSDNLFYLSTAMGKKIKKLCYKIQLIVFIIGV